MGSASLSWGEEAAPHRRDGRRERVTGRTVGGALPPCPSLNFAPSDPGHTEPPAAWPQAVPYR